MVASRHPFSLYYSVNLYETMTGQLEQVIIERRQHLCLADKLRLMAQTLRSAKLKQNIGQFYDNRNDSFCAYGALGFLSGIPKDDLVGKANFETIYKNYGMDLAESSMAVALPEEARSTKEGKLRYPEREVSLWQAIWQMNDHGYNFKEIATYLDQWADDLQS